MVITMFKSTKKFPLLILGILGCIFLFGCSSASTLDTELVLNEDGSGSRIMYATLNDSVISSHYSGTMEDIKNIIKASIPVGLAFEEVVSDSSTDFIFTLDFTSIDDYKSKVQSITGTEPTISVEFVDEAFGLGIRASEDFTSSRLLTWLNQALVGAGVTTESNSQYIFEAGDTRVIYDDISFISSGNTVSVDDIGTYKLDAFNVYTSINPTRDLYTRRIEFVMPIQTYEDRQDLINALLEERAPGCKISWTDGENNTKVVSIKKSDVDFDTLNSFSTSFFNADRYSMTLSEYDKSYRFYDYNDFDEIFDLSTLYPLDYLDYTESFEINNYIAIIPAYKTSSDVETEYGQAFGCSSSYILDMSSHSVLTSYSLFDSHTEEITVLKDDNYLLKLELKYDKSTSINNMNKDYDIIKSDVLGITIPNLKIVLDDLDKENSSIRINFEGKADDISTAMDRLFYRHYEFEYSAQENLFAITGDSEYFHNADAFVDSDDNKDSDFTSTLIVTTNNKDKIKKKDVYINKMSSDDIEEGTLELSQGQLVYTTTGGDIFLSFEGKPLNIFALVIYSILCIILLAVASFVTIIILKTRKAKANKLKEALQANEFSEGNDMSANEDVPDTEKTPNEDGDAKQDMVD